MLVFPSSGLSLRPGVWTLLRVLAEAGGGPGGPGVSLLAALLLVAGLLCHPSGRSPGMPRTQPLAHAATPPCLPSVFLVVVTVCSWSSLWVFSVATLGARGQWGPLSWASSGWVCSQTVHSRGSLGEGIGGIGRDVGSTARKEVWVLVR